MKPNASAIVLILLALLTGPICDAQINAYTKLKRGHPCPYDSCVATELNQWRRESVYIRELRLENSSLYSETNSLRSEIQLADSVADTYESELRIMQRAIIRKDSINAKIADDLKQIHYIAKKALEPDRWFEKNWFWFSIGVFGTLLITR